MNFNDTVLLSLRRKYSKDEAVAELSRQLAAAQFEIGELKSEISELVHALAEKPEPEKKDVKQSAKVPLAFKLDEYAAELKRQIKQQQESKLKYKKEAKKWQDAYYGLIAKVNNGDK